MVKTTDVYWIKAYGVMQRFLNEKQFARIFRHRQEDVLKYIKDNSIDIRNRQDVIKLLRYCNEI